MSKKLLLFTGCAGELGNFFVGNYGDFYDIVGVSRRAPRDGRGLMDFLKADLTNGGEEIVRYVLNRYGRIDVLVNAAVIFRGLKLQDETFKNFIEELAVNVAAPLDLSNQVLKQFWSNIGFEDNYKNNRSIVNISSISGTRLYENIGHGSYAASKAALNMLTEHLASEYRNFGIRVNAVAPYYFKNVGLKKVCQSISGFIEGKQSGQIRILDKEAGLN